MSGSANSCRPAAILPSRSATGFQWLVSRILGWDIALIASSLALISFSLPGRVVSENGNGADFIGIAKLLLRSATISWFLVLIMLSTRWPAAYQRRLIPREIVPWFIFGAWAGVTIAWSPMLTISLGQWLGLIALILLAHAVSDRVRQAETDSPSTDRPFSEKLIWQLTLILNAYVVMVLLVHAIAPSASGLDRSVSLEGSNGIVHPTAAGASASLGLVFAMFALVRSNEQPRLYWWSALIANLSLLLLSNSRAAIASFLLCALIYWSWAFSPRLKGFSLICFAVCCFAIVLLDPGLQALEGVFGETISYMTRNQSVDQLKGVSGRGELWEAIWKEYWNAPLLGHGYFVTSSEGKLDVWNTVSNQDAHNLLLQALVTTGLLGFGLFVWALISASWSVARRCVLQKRRSKPIHPVDFLVLVVFVWYACWGQTCTTFLGPIRPESVVFFVILGIVIGSASTRNSTK